MVKSVSPFRIELPNLKKLTIGHLNDMSSCFCEADFILTGMMINLFLMDRFALLRGFVDR